MKKEEDIGDSVLITESVRRSPFHTYLMVLCIITGLTFMLGVRETELDHPTWVVWVWNVSLVFFGSVSIISVRIRDLLYSKLLARISMLYMAVLSAGFATSVAWEGEFAVQHLVSASLIWGFSAACAVEAYRVHRELRTWRKVIRERHQ